MKTLFAMVVLLHLLVTPVNVARGDDYRELYDKSTQSSDGSRPFVLELFRAYIFQSFDKYEADAMCAEAVVEAFEGKSSWQDMGNVDSEKCHCIIVEIYSNESIDPEIQAARDAALHLFLIACLRNRHVAVRRITSEEQLVSLKLCIVGNGVSVRESKRLTVEAIN